MNKMTGECTQETFWVEVAHFGWGTKTTDHKAIKREMLERYDDAFLRSFHERYDDVESDLYGRVERWVEANGESSGCGDDGFGDLLSHVIGLGKEIYERSMENPRGVVRRGQASDYVEKFSYSFPFPPTAADESVAEAVETIREEREGRGDDDEVLNEDSLLQEALHRVLGDRAEQDPRLYGAWAREQKVGLEALMASEFGVEFGADLPFVVGAFTEVAKNEPQLIFARDVEKVVKALERIEKKREGILAKIEARAAVLRKFSYWGCRNMVTGIQERFGSEE